MSEPELAKAPVVAAAKAKLRLGLLPEALFHELYEPVFLALSERQGDEGLHQLISSIVSSIAAQEVYEAYRSLDDIFQRYLYYRESLCDFFSSAKEGEAVRRLYHFWRQQALIILVREAGAVYELLIPGQSPRAYELCCDSAELLSALLQILPCRLDAQGQTTTFGLDPHAQALYAFLCGHSLPFLGFRGEDLFGYMSENLTLDDDIEDSFAVISADYVRHFARALRQALEDSLYIDFIYAQFPKVYRELTEAFELERAVPRSAMAALQQRFRFDAKTQQAIEALMQGKGMTRPLHRNSRLDRRSLNLCSRLLNFLNVVETHGEASYLFHFYE